MDEEEELGEDGFQINDNGDELDPLDEIVEEDGVEDPDDRFH